MPTPETIKQPEVPTARDSVQELVGHLQAHIIIESPKAGPGIAALIGRVLLDAGADVTLDPRFEPMPNRPRNLLGMKVHIGRTVWIRQEEADRIMPNK